MTLSLYFVVPLDQEADFCLFVTAETPEEAAKIWRNYYGPKHSDESETDFVRIFSVPRKGMTAKAHKWREDAVIVWEGEA